MGSSVAHTPGYSRLGRRCHPRLNGCRLSNKNSSITGYCNTPGICAFPVSHIFHTSNAPFSGHSRRLSARVWRDWDIALLHCAHISRSNNLAFELYRHASHTRKERASICPGTKSTFAWYFSRPDCISPIADHQPDGRPGWQYRTDPYRSCWCCTGYHIGNCHKYLPHVGWKTRNQVVAPEYSSTPAGQDTLFARYSTTGRRRLYSRPTVSLHSHRFPGRHRHANHGCTICTLTRDTRVLL